MPDVVLGIDTSNYTTSMALCDVEGRVLHNGKKLLPVKEGECGLRQSDALFHHVRQIPELLELLRPHLQGNRIVAVGYSARPRNRDDSYMPCFLAGKSVAESISTAMGVPLFSFSHQCGHIYAALYSAGRCDLADGEFGAFHVSGGTTEMLRVRPCEGGFTAEIVGGSRDLHAGQAIDRIGVMLGLPFPAGPHLEKLAMANTDPFAPKGLHTKDGYIHLSGLENMATTMYQKGASPSCVCAFTLDHLSRGLLAMANYYREALGNEPLVFAGGVMSNRIIRDKIAAKLSDVWFSEPAFSADNAAGIALLAARAYRAGR